EPEPEAQAAVEPPEAERKFRYRRVVAPDECPEGHRAGELDPGRVEETFRGPERVEPDASPGLGEEGEGVRLEPSRGIEAGVDPAAVKELGGDLHLDQIRLRWPRGLRGDGGGGGGELAGRRRGDLPGGRDSRRRGSCRRGGGRRDGGRSRCRRGRA